LKNSHDGMPSGPQRLIALTDSTHFCTPFRVCTQAPVFQFFNTYRRPIYPKFSQKVINNVVKSGKKW